MTLETLLERVKAAELALADTGSKKRIAAAIRALSPSPAAPSNDAT